MAYGPMRVWRIAWLARLSPLIPAGIAALVGVGCAAQNHRVQQVISSTSISGEQRCPAIDSRHLSAERAAIIEGVRIEACRVLVSESYRQLMAREFLRERCDSNLRISGESLNQLLVWSVPDHWVVAGKPLFAEAATNPFTGRIKIRKKRFRDWAAGGENQGDMINTLVHEWTHLIAQTDVSSRFQDRGHGSALCPDAQLASYRAGDLAEQAWRELRQGEAASGN